MGMIRFLQGLATGVGVTVAYQVLCAVRAYDRGVAGGDDYYNMRDEDDE